MPNPVEYINSRSADLAVEVPGVLGVVGAVPDGEALAALVEQPRSQAQVEKPQLPVHRQPHRVRLDVPGSVGVRVSKE